MMTRAWMASFVWMEKTWKWAWIVPMVAASWWFYNAWTAEPWLSYKVLPLAPRVDAVRAGEIIPLRAYRCNASGTTRNYTMTRTLYNINGSAYVMDSVVVSIDAGCTDQTSLVNRIPREVEPGRYRIVALSAIQGTLRTIEVPWESGWFEVTK